MLTPLFRAALQVLQQFADTGALLWSTAKHAFEDIFEGGVDLVQRFRPLCLTTTLHDPHLLQGPVGDCARTGVAAHPQQNVQLVHVGLALECLLPLQQLQVDRRCPEHVHPLVVVAAEHHLQRPVPASDHVVSMRLKFCVLGKAEVDELDSQRRGVDHHVLGLDVTVHDALAVQVGQPCADLGHDFFDLPLGESALGEPPVELVVLGEVHGEVLEHQVVGVVSLDEIEEGGDVGVGAPPQYLQLPFLDVVGGGVLEANHLDCQGALRLLAHGLVDSRVRPLPDLLHQPERCHQQYSSTHLTLKKYFQPHPQNPRQSGLMGLPMG